MTAVSAALILAFTCMPAVAVVIDSSSSDFSVVRSAPADDPGWNRVGKVGIGAGSGVYLGNGWVLTAAHVGVGDFTVDGQTFLAKSGAGTVVANADLLLYQLQTSPNLGDVQISSTRPAVGSLVTMIGLGQQQQPGKIFWDSGWNQVSQESEFSYSGYGLGGVYTKQWGENYISRYEEVNGVQSFVTQFTDRPGDTLRAQAVPGDSGGAVFFKNGSLWELAGIMHAASRYAGQPNGTVAYSQSVSPYGKTYTFTADLSVYRDQIVTITAVPEPGAGILALFGASVVVCGALMRRRPAKTL